MKVVDEGDAYSDYSLQLVFSTVTLTLTIVISAVSTELLELWSVLSSY